MIGGGFQNEMRANFDPLLADLDEATDLGVLVAGGYGLFLKQQWLLQNPQIPIIISLDQWQDFVPRVTKDLDLVLSLQLIASADAQQSILGVLTKHQFTVSDRNPRWQFVKMLPAGRTIMVELHAPLPTIGIQGLVADRIRLKRKPSLGDAGIHGRTNPEAVGCDLHPLRFEQNGFAYHVPNPLTWSIMKLTAAQDRWQRSMSVQHAEGDRAFSREQAIKHIGDACRIVAMVTRDENDQIPDVAAVIKASEQFQKAAEIVALSFPEEDGWMSQVLANHWNSAHLTMIRNTLVRWFHG